MKRRLDEFVRSLVKPHAGGNEPPEERKIVVLSLNEFAADQRQRTVLLGIALVILLLVPVMLLLSSVPRENLAYLLGGTGLFTAGTLKYLIDALKDMAQAHMLAVVSQGLDSIDAREVLTVWLKSRK
jgi:hypothetical protein